MMKRIECIAAGVATVLIVASVATAQTDKTQARMRNASQMKLGVVPQVPTCATAEAQMGDPATTEFILFVRAKRGCVIPWHWHTANENLMIVDGVAEIAMKDMNAGKPVDMKSGGFVHLPSKHVHQFRCKQACTFYLYSDGKFDIHYVDAEGNEITPEQANEPVKQQVATAK